MVLLKIVGDKITVELQGPSPTVVRGTDSVRLATQPDRHTADPVRGTHTDRARRTEILRTPYTERKMKYSCRGQIHQKLKAHDFIWPLRPDACGLIGQMHVSSQARCMA